MAARSILLLAVVIGACEAINLPGVGARQWNDGDPVNLKVSRIDSIKTQLPFDYYSLPFCKPDEVTQFAENLGNKAPMRHLARTQPFCR